MLTQQELLVSELMGIMLGIQNSKDDRLKKVGWLSMYPCGSTGVLTVHRLRNFGIRCLLRKICSGFDVQSDCP